MDCQSPPRLIRPVTSTLRADGAPFVRLSPHKGMRNASIIYEAIRNLPDTTAIRGDFDKHAYPQVYFPVHSRKTMSGSPATRAIKAKNIASDRQEFASFLSSIVDTAFRSKNSGRDVVKACVVLRDAIFSAAQGTREFRVGDIREPLRVIARAYTQQNVCRLGSPPPAKAHAVSARQLKQVDGFTHMSADTYRRLVTAMRPGRSERYFIGPELPVVEMKLMLKAFQKAQAAGKENFPDFLRKYGVSADVHAFAVRWLRMSIPKQSAERKLFNDQPWAAELDNLSQLIIREFRRQAQVSAQAGQEADGPGLVYQRGRNTTLPPASAPVDAGSRQAFASARVPPRDLASPGFSTRSTHRDDTPEDERALRQVMSRIEALPPFDLDLDIGFDMDHGLPSGLVARSASAGAPAPDTDFADPDDALADLLANTMLASGTTIDYAPTSERDDNSQDGVGFDAQANDHRFSQQSKSYADSDEEVGSSS